MQSKQNLIEIREKIQFGGIKKIMIKSESSRMAINKFFKGDLKNPQKKEKIQNAIIDVLKEYKELDETFYNNVKLF